MSLLLAPCRASSGELPAQATLDWGVEVSVHGPRPVTTHEPAMFTALVEGGEEAMIAGGVILMAHLQSAAYLPQEPVPAASYMPFGEAPPQGAGAWRPLLACEPPRLWATRLVPMAHPLFGGTPGALLDLTAFNPAWPQPPAESAFRDCGKYDQLGVAFLTDEGFRLGPDASVPGATDTFRPARGVRVSFPLRLAEPDARVLFWLALDVAHVAHGERRVLSRMLALTAGGREGAPGRPQTPAERLVILAPAEDTLIEETVTVRGNALPGSLVVAWLETYAAPHADMRTAHPVARHIADASGRFTITLRLDPVAYDPAMSVIAELRMRTEAPGYRSPEITRRLLVRRGS